METYGLTTEKYLDLFKEKTLLTLQALNVLTAVAAEHSIEIANLGPKFVWDLFEKISYATEDACRLHQKEHDPAEIELRKYDPLCTSPTRDALFAQIKELEELLEDHIKQGGDEGDIR